MSDVTVDPSVLALASVIVAGIAAVSSPVSNQLIARARNGHERRQAAIERRQRRLEPTYRELIPYLLRLRDTVARTEPFLKWEGEPGPPEPLGEDDLRRIETEVALNGSHAILERLQAIVALSRTFYANVGYYRDMKAGRAPETAGDTRTAGEQMEASRKSLFEAVREAVERANEELQSD